MLQRMDSDKLMTFTTTLMTSLSGAMASVILLNSDGGLYVV